MTTIYAQPRKCIAGQTSFTPTYGAGGRWHNVLDMTRTRLRIVDSVLFAGLADSAKRGAMPRRRLIERCSVDCMPVEPHRDCSCWAAVRSAPVDSPRVMKSSRELRGRTRLHRGPE